MAWALELPVRGWLAGPAKILGNFGLKEGERTLEIGPGSGYYARHAIRLLGENGKLVCLDIQLEMLNLLKRKLGAEGGVVDLVQGDAGRLPIASGVFDRVYLITVLGELPDRPAALREIRRALRPGGRLSVSEQLPDPDFVRLPTLRKELSAAGFEEESTRGKWNYTSTWRSTD